ncbi:papain-like cysteine protease family protein [Streptomyces olivoreticuli]|uniref:papain-like cysteine protease family protein n=1 Tax=Streptomyces olivoreticuli TaxID=68246 RepID=UPI000E266433|nr:papain-like cysteine protease family protein [Streptomyces olivoreticuli]
MSRASAQQKKTGKSRIRGRRLSVAALVASALLAVPTTASAATGGNQPGLAASKKLNITMQAQQKTNWCWAGSGNTIATWFGRNYSQNQFCNAAFNRQQGTECPNNQATLGNVQNALDWAGINSGSYVSGWLRYSTVQSEISANRPVETRIQWSSGGGHMHVLYGYDDSNSWVYWGDPWPSNNRYNWASHGWYVDNDQFSWTHSLYRIGA